mmetsp:Transcript_31299/g.75657  ORF Transcript_31299/g.75657 Transcript_31299/m.75657 type:complete len:202 (-) Transcript_31299:1586-2191(-)
MAARSAPIGSVFCSSRIFCILRVSASALALSATASETGGGFSLAGGAGHRSGVHTLDRYAHVASSCTLTNTARGVGLAFLPFLLLSVWAVAERCWFLDSNHRSISSSVQHLNSTSIKRLAPVSSQKSPLSNVWRTMGPPWPSLRFSLSFLILSSSSLPWRISTVLYCASSLEVWRMVFISCTSPFLFIWTTVVVPSQISPS